jgi:WD40 repeat protein
MGVVYRARQDGLNRIVAIKVLPGAAFASAGFRARFQREAETAARLRHPGIVAIHEIGEAMGQPFLSMDYIDGPSLADRLAESKVTPELGAHLVREVARAVAHAHRHGVVHRDLKPSNVLLAAGNQPVLTDFGLARFLEPSANHGLSLDLTGSPPYLPPERVTSGQSTNGVAEDVYGLGAVLYHCLTGRPPFVADSISALLAVVAETEPVPPRRLNPSVAKDLETICLKCLEKNPASRYASAENVALEIDRFLRGEPIEARPRAPVDHLCLAIRRKPVVAALGFLLLLAVVAGTVISMIGWNHAARNAREALALAEWRRVDLYSGTMAAATAAYETGNRGQMRHLLGECLPGRGESDLRGPEWFLLDHLARPRELFAVHAHAHILTSLAWSPSGAGLLSACHDGSLRLWALAEGNTLRPVAELLPAGRARIHRVRWLGLDDRIFLAAEGDKIRCRKIGEPKPLWELPGSQFDLTDEARLLAISTGNPFNYEPTGTVSLWKLPPDGEGKPLLERTLSEPARAVAISPDARWLALGMPPREHADDEQGLMLLDLQAPDAPPRVTATRAAVWSLAFSPDSRLLVAATISEGGRAHCLDVSTGMEQPLAGGHAARVWSAVFTADSRRLLTTSTDRAIRNATLDGSQAESLRLAHDNEIWTAAIHPAEAVIATGDKDGNVKLYPLPLPGEPAGEFPRHAHFRYALPVFTPDSSGIVVCEAGSNWRSIRWNPAGGETEEIIAPVHPLDISADGTVVWFEAATGGLWKRGPGQPSARILPPGETLPIPDNRHLLGISPERGHLFLISGSGRANRVDLATGATNRVDGLCRLSPVASALSPGGRYLAAATWEELAIHDFGIGKTTRLPNHRHWAKAIAFSQDGRRMFTGGGDGRIIVRSLPDFALAGTLSGHLSEVSGLAVSPDGKTLVSSEIGFGLRFWRLDTLHEVMRLPMPEVCEILVFAPDGQSLAVVTCPPASPPEKGVLVVIPCPRAGDGGGQ